MNLLWDGPWLVDSRLAEDEIAVGYLSNAETSPGLMRATPAVAGDASGLGGGDSPNVLRLYYDHDEIMTTWRGSVLIPGLLRHWSAMEALRCS
jgi:hypothetical protein